MSGVQLFDELQKAAHRIRQRLEAHGMQISIENPVGSVRKWYDPLKDEHGETKMRNAYGYIRLSEGADGDHVDCYIGPRLQQSRTAYVVHQHDPKTGKYDEDKVMLGFDSAADAKAAYLAHYDDPKFFGSMDAHDVDQLAEHVKRKKGKIGKELSKAMEALLSKARQLEYIDKMGRKWLWNEGLKKYVYQRKGRKKAAPDDGKKKPAKQPDDGGGKKQAADDQQSERKKKAIERAKKIIAMAMEKKSVKEISEETGVSVARIHQLIGIARKQGIDIASLKKKRIPTEQLLQYEARERSKTKQAVKLERSAQPYKKDKITATLVNVDALPQTNYVGDDLRKVLRDHQVDFVNQAMAQYDNGEKSVMNFDGTGTGKTMQEIALAETYLEHHPDAKVLIVTESERIMRDAFARDGKHLKIPLTRVRKADEVTKPGIYICKYPELKKLNSIFPDTGLVILDEAHNLKNVTMSKKGRAGIKLLDHAKNAALFTATPADKPIHLEYLCAAFNLNFKRVMKYLGYKRDRFGWKAHTTLDQVVYKMDGIFRHLTDKGLLTKREVPMDNLDLNLRTVQLSPDYLSRYNAAVEKMQLDLKLAGPREKGLTKAKWLVRIRSLLEEAKIDSAVEEMKTAIADGKQAVLFAARVNDSMVQDANKKDHFVRFAEGTLKKMEERLKEQGVEFVSVFGSSKKAIEDVKKFQSGKVKVILTTPQSGGTGISLDDTAGNAPRRLVMMTPPFSANDFIQMLGRVNRLQTKSRSEAVMIGTDTVVDQWNRNIIGNKLKMLGAVVKGDYESLSVEDLELATSLPPDQAAAFLQAQKKKRASAPAAGPSSFDPKHFTSFDMSAYMKSMPELQRRLAVLQKSTAINNLQQLLLNVQREPVRLADVPEDVRQVLTALQKSGWAEERDGFLLLSAKGQTAARLVR